MAAATMTKPARFLLSSASSILRLRRSPCQSHFLLHSSRRLFCDMHTPEENDPAPFDPTLLKSGDWTPKVIRSIPVDLFEFDLGRWIVKIDHPGLKSGKLCQEKELYDTFVKAVTAIVGSEEEAKKRIYLMSNDPIAPGFGIYADKKLADKLKDVDIVIRLTPDYYEEARDSDPETCLVSM